MKDKNGIEIKPGDILHQVVNAYGDVSYHYHICFQWGKGYEVEIRDLGANNLYISEPEEECINLGHISQCYKNLPEGVWNSSDWEYYFRIPAHHDMTGNYNGEDWYDLEVRKFNNFPEDWELPEEDKV